MKKKFTPFSLQLPHYVLFVLLLTVSSSLLAHVNAPAYYGAHYADVPVHGKITDEDGNPVPGVTVQLKGTPQATTTDAKGDFTLTVPANATLVISHVGFERKEIKLSDRQKLNIQLSRSSAGLNEVVVVAVGYGTQKKRDVTSAVSQINGEEVRQTPVTSLQNALSGKLPGLFSQQRSGQPGNNAAAIFIRGVSTFTGSQQPLVLIDNIEYEFDQLANIDPREVESVSILKDAASTAIYGIRGANGVILVTTRRGKTGKALINFTTQAGIQTPTTILKTLGSYDVALLQNEANKNDGTAPMFTDHDIELFKSGADPYGHPDVNWYDALFKKHALMTNTNLDISGGTKRVKYFVTLGYMNQGGMLRDIPYLGKDQAASGKTQAETNFYAKRYKFRSNLDIQATNTLQLQLDITGTREAANQPKEESLFPNIFRYDYASPYMMPVYNPDGSFGWGNPKWMVPPAASNNFAAVYALGGYTTNVNDFVNIRMAGSQDLDDITKGLSLKSVIGYSFGNNSATTLVRHAVSIPSYFYNAETQTYSPKDATIFTMPPYQLSYAGGSPNQRLNIQGSLNYDNSFGLHNLSALLLYNQTSYINGANPPANFRGYTFRLGYNFDHKYMFQVSGAYNGSDRFVSQRQYQLFPAFSAGWNIGEESFIRENVPFIESLKLRGSYGWVGSDDIGGNQYLYEQVYDRTGTYSFGQFNNTINSIIEGTQGNNNITWQTERKADMGMDFSLLRGRITGSVDYFDNFRYDILTRRLTVPNYFGVQTSNLPPVNIGQVSNKGYEIELGYRGTVGKVGINIRGNVSFAKNKIVFMDEVEPKYPWQRQTGQSIGMIKQYTWLGFYQNQEDIDTSAAPPGTVKPGYLKYQDLNGDGLINTDDMAYQGNPNLPSTNLGLTLGASYKGLSLTILLQSAVNFDIYMGNGNAVPFKTNLQPIHLGRWTPEKASTATFPALTTTFNGSYMNPDNRSTFWTTPGNYLRVRSMTLNYNLPKRMVNSIGLGAVNVFMNGYDLFTWSKFMKRFQFDPEVSTGAGGFIYPTQKIVNFGLSVSLK